MAKLTRHCKTKFLTVYLTIYLFPNDNLEYSYPLNYAKHWPTNRIIHKLEMKYIITLHNKDKRERKQMSFKWIAVQYI